MKTQTTTDREIVITRLIDAPLERVWQAFADPEQVARWWGPYGFSTDVKEREFKVGGTWKHTMIGPDGTHYPNLGKYLEIVDHERIVYTNGGGKKGAPGTRHTSTTTFVAKGKKTEVTMRLVFDDPNEKDLTEKTYGATIGGQQHLTRLDQYLHPFEIERVFDAPRERVWKALTDAKELNQWMSPKGMKPTKATVDLRVGGVYHYGMQSPDGKIMWGKQTYKEIQAPERLTVVVSFSDEKQGVTRHPLAANWPLETLSTTILEEMPGGKTKMKLRWTAYNAAEGEYEMFLKSFDGMKGGWGSTMDQLAEHLKKPVREAVAELNFERLIDAPVQRVYEAWTKPQQVEQWFAPKPFRLIIKKMDFRNGGSFEMAMRGPDGGDFPFTGTYRDIDPPNRVAWGAQFTGDVEQQETVVTFEAVGNKTRLKARQTFWVMTPVIKEALKGANVGWNMTLDQLEKFVA